MDGEVFRQIVGFPGYEVSSMGRVKSLERMVRGKTSLRRCPERILRQATCGKNRNYLFVVLSIDGVPYKARVAHLVASAFIGERPSGCDVDHIDGDTFNNSLKNLRYLNSSVNRGMRRTTARA